MTRVLLITGARSLADDPAAEAWARDIIAEALAGVDLLIVGDADGPDAWARSIATWGETRIHCYHVHGRHRGWITDSYSDDPLTRWDEGIRQGRRYPLDRNAAMVADAARMLREGHTVSVLALLDGRKPAVVQPGEKRPTRGTEHTVGLARAAGLTVDARTWPKGATT